MWLGSMFFVVTILVLNSCGQPAVHSHVVDKVYLIAADQIEQLSLVYQNGENMYAGLIPQTVFAVGFNEDFIIAKQHPSEFNSSLDKNSTLYYIIDLNSIKRARNVFVEKIDTVRFRSSYKDKDGADSLGAEERQISTSAFSPQKPEALTFKQFNLKKKELKIPDSLGFTISYKELQ